MSAQRTVASRPGPALLTPRIALVLLAQFVFGLGWSAYLVQPKYLATVLGAPPDAIARVIVMSPLSAVLVMPLAMAVMDRGSRVWIFRAGTLLLLVASLGYLARPPMGPWLLLLQAAVGTSYVLAFNASASVVADGAPPERLGEAIGFLGASNVVTNALATTMAEHLASTHGWSASFALSACLAVAALALSARIRDEAPSRGARPAEPLGPSLRGPLGRVLVGSALAGAAFSAMFTFHQPYALSLGGKTVSQFFVGFTVTAVVSRVFFGSLGDRRGHREVSVVAMIAYGAVALATARLRPDLLWVHGLAFGAAHGVLYPTLNTHGVHSAPPGARGRVITVYGGAFNVGVAFATLVWGKVAAAWGFPPVFVGAGLLAFAGALVLATPGAARRPAPHRAPGGGHF